MIIRVVSDEPIDRFREAAVRWAAGGRGQVLVDAAVQALIDGIDSPSLRMLAGAQAASADEDANAYGPDTFDELGLEIAKRGSERAVVDGARLRAEDFLAGSGRPDALAGELYRAWVETGYGEELGDWSGLADWYSLIDEGYVDDDRSAVDASVQHAAEAFVRGERIGAPGVGGPFSTTDERPSRSLLGRIFRRRR